MKKDSKETGGKKTGKVLDFLKRLITGKSKRAGKKRIVILIIALIVLGFSYVFGSEEFFTQVFNIVKQFLY